MHEADVGFRSKLCAFFGIDRSSTYDKHVQDEKDSALAEQIRAVHIEHPGYGHRRLAIELHVGKNRIRRVMKAYGIAPPSRKRKKHIKSNQASKTAPPNLLKAHTLQQADGTTVEIPGLAALYPHHIWAEDFTYLWFQGRFYYLATVIDLYSRQIVGWSIGKRHDTALVTAALMDAVSKYPAPAVMHNDQGSEYLSRQYQTICASLEITASASVAGHPWENGFQESFYNGFKLDLGDIAHLETEGQLMEAIAWQLHYYNTKRIHSALGTNPAAYAARYVQVEPEIKTEVTERESQSVQEMVRSGEDRVLVEVGT